MRDLRVEGPLNCSMQKNSKEHFMDWLWEKGPFQKVLQQSEVKTITNSSNIIEAPMTIIIVVVEKIEDKTITIEEITGGMTLTKNTIPMANKGGEIITTMPL